MIKTSAIHDVQILWTEMICLDELQERIHSEKRLITLIQKKKSVYIKKDVARLLADEGIIRNRRKIESVINNAGRHNDMGIAWELSIHGCIQTGLKVDLPGNHVGSQVMEEPEINYSMGQL